MQIPKSILAKILNTSVWASFLLHFRKDHDREASSGFEKVENHEERMYKKNRFSDLKSHIVQTPMEGGSTQEKEDTAGASTWKTRNQP